MRYKPERALNKKEGVNKTANLKIIGRYISVSYLWYLKMNDFTILHLSDLHINQTDGRLSLLMENLLIDIV